jgi:hypothetical protein
MRLEERIRALEAFADLTGPVLSLYVDVNPAKPENAGRAWLKRAKNALKELPDQDREGKRDLPLRERVLELLEQERPAAKTLALFAARDEHGKLLSERLDLQVELPVVDLAHGRVEARWGAPYLTPLFFALNESWRVGILHLEGAHWRLYTYFLGELNEERIFEEIGPGEWSRLNEAATCLAEGMPARLGGTLDKLAPSERLASKMEAWTHRLYQRLAHLLEQAAVRLGFERLILMGEQVQVSHFQGYLSRAWRERLIARLPHPAQPGPKGILERVEPVLEEARVDAELKLLDEIAAQPGLWGVDPVLEALQMGRVEVWVLPWSLELKLWRCPEGVAGSQETARIWCANPEEVALRDEVWRLAQEYGARLEFVRGKAEERVVREFGGMAAWLRF